jgi:hypothetical protein
MTDLSVFGAARTPTTGGYDNYWITVHSLPDANRWFKTTRPALESNAQADLGLAN